MMAHIVRCFGDSVKDEERASRLLRSRASTDTNIHHPAREIPSLVLEGYDPWVRVTPHCGRPRFVAVTSD